jgi:hypothetical protein
MRAPILLIALGIVLFGGSDAFADKRVALVIGNSTYRSAPALTNPKNDAADVGQSLRALGFETIVATDLDRTGMNDALDRFSRVVGGADIALVYYSGHGMQFAGRNYLLPIEATLSSLEDVNKFRLLPLDDVFDVLQMAQGARVIILDACRNNPVEEEFKRRIASRPGANRDALLTRGLGRVSVGNGLIVAYSTQSNDVASDGTGRNSPFTSAFLKNVSLPDIDLRNMLFRVQDEVDRETKGRQRPELSISLVGEFKLVASGGPRPPAAAAPAVSPNDEARRDFDYAMKIGTKEAWDVFLAAYPTGFFANLAHAQRATLTAAPPAPGPVPPATVGPAPAPPAAAAPPEQKTASRPEPETRTRSLTRHETEKPARKKEKAARGSGRSGGGSACGYVRRMTRAVNAAGLGGAVTGYAQSQCGG